LFKATAYIIVNNFSSLVATITNELATCVIIKNIAGYSATNKDKKIKTLRCNA
jgi:hypothetical protein